MKLTFKTLNNAQFTVDDIEPQTTTVGDLKMLLSRWPEAGFDEERAGDCKLIHSGKVLADASRLVSECALKEGDFVVVMPPRKRVERKRVADEQAAPALATKQEDVAVPKGEAPAASSATSALPATAADPASSSAMVSGDAYRQSIEQMKEMGFEEEAVVRAMRAAYNNPERAIEYLFQGVPENVGNEETGESHTAAAPTNPSVTTNAAGNPLEALRRLPHINLLRRMVQQDPSQLRPLLAELQRLDPRIVERINENQGEFVAFMNEPVSDEDAERDLQQLQALMRATGVDPASGSNATAAAAAANALLRGATGGGGDDGDRAPQMVRIEVSQEEMEQIQRLEELVGPMGVSREACLEAWLSCDRNEEMAAAYILENLDDYTGHGEGEEDGDDEDEEQLG
ncbi:hypothetical protein CDCA_CDCA04G1398 [Cyanidium caldarium]|uniref:UV excision repair protein RAD23 n=1 Tax=Cyanidium caldarium TaxID=2771 RepID=A0AAV9ITH1_CYACA|nr:hypothetical protein CDCA_CDCA04G1398 [Cyanidium caldarium]